MSRSADAGATVPAHHRGMTTTTAPPAARTRQFRLGARTRKSLLLAHIVATALWFGVDIAFGILTATALGTDDPVTAGSALRAVAWFAIWPMFGASMLSLATGVLLGLGSRYGLLRYWWVAAKLALNVLMSILILMVLRPGVGEAAGLGERLLAGDPTAEVPSGLIFPVVVAPTMLLTAYLLSVFKPRARIRRSPSGPEPARTPAATPA